MQIYEFLENEGLTTDFAETQQVNDLLWKLFFEIFDPIDTFRGKRGQNPPQKRFLQHLWQILSLDFDQT